MQIKGIIFIFTVISFMSFGQDSTVVSDFELWTGVTVKKSFLEKKLGLGLNQQFRFDENSSHLDAYFTDISADYELVKGLQLGLGYRFIRNNKNSGYKNEERFYADVNYKHKLERFTLRYRFRFQYHDEIGRTKEEGDYPDSKFRLRLKAEYDIKKWKLDPYLSFEAFFKRETNTYNYISSVTEIERVSGFEKLRFTLGTSYKINKTMEVGGFYRIEQELKSYRNFYNTPATYYIVGLNFTFNL